jgi:hypothetical protein
MKALSNLSYAGKLAGFVSTLNVIPFVDPAVGAVIFAAASLLKDSGVPPLSSASQCAEFRGSTSLGTLGSCVFQRATGRGRGKEKS